MSQKRKRFVAVAAIVVAVFGAGVIMLRGNSANYWVTPGQLAGSPNQAGPVRVGGKMTAGSLKTDNGKVAFAIKARGESLKLPVEYTGFVPEAFSDLSEVVVEGSVSEGTLYADKILVRCPENYVAEKATISAYKALGIDGMLYR